MTARIAALIMLIAVAAGAGPALAHSDASSFEGGTGMHDHAVEQAEIPARFAARVTLDPRGLHDVSMKVNARIVDISSGPVGSRVTKGQVLARFSSAELNTLQTTFVETVRNAGLMMAASVTGEAKLIEGRMNLVWRGMSDAEVARIERSRQPLEEVEVVSPMDGFLTEVDVAAGRLVSAGTRGGLFSATGTRIFQIARDDALIIEAQLPADALVGLKVGDRMAVSVAGLADAEDAAAEVIEIPPLIGSTPWRRMVRLAPSAALAAVVKPGQAVLLSQMPVETAEPPHDHVAPAPVPAAAGGGDTVPMPAAPEDGESGAEDHSLPPAEFDEISPIIEPVRTAP